MNTPVSTIAPFATKPNLVLIAPTSSATMVQELNLGINLKAGTISVNKKNALLAAAVALVGIRKGSESAEKWISRAQKSLNDRFSAN